MAKPSTSAGQKPAGRAAPPAASSQQRTPAQTAAPADSGVLDAARAALARGDVRTARRIARQIATTGTEADRAAAGRFLAELAPDAAALLAAAVVLVVIGLAAWLALFRAH